MSTELNDRSPQKSMLNVLLVTVEYSASQLVSNKNWCLIHKYVVYLKLLVANE